MARTTVADVVVDGLRRAGVSRVFTAPSTRGLVGLENAFARHGLTLMRAATPAAACVMAAVVGQLDDAPGLVTLGADDVETSHPGLGYAADSRAAVIALTATPEAATVAKGSVVVDAASAAHWTAHAVQLALKDPRGPVQLVVPESVQGDATLPVATAMRPAPSAPEAGALDDAAAMLGAAARPILIVGLECRSADVAAWIRPIAEALPSPVLTTLGGKGALPDPHPLALGLMGSSTARVLVDRADLIVTIGVDVRELPPSAWLTATPILRIARGADADAQARHPSVELIGDIALSIEELAPRLRSRARADWDVAELDRLKRRSEASARAETDAAADVAGLARELTPAGTIMIVGAVTNLPAVAAAWPAVAPGEFLSFPRDDFALAATMAVAARDSRRRVVCVTRGDVTGLAELEMVARLGAPVVIVMFGTPASAPPAPIVATTALDAAQRRAAIAAAWLRAIPTLIVTGPV